MRGWTLSRRALTEIKAGSPAHAGMDPISLFPPVSTKRLPRACGDGPRLVLRIQQRNQAPPRMRGWTHDRPVDFVNVAGSPAHAGMDLRDVHTETLGRGLPRACGDGPLFTGLLRLQRLAPPRMRGWTQFRSVCRYGTVGSPAHAGMDQFSRFYFSSTRRLPRACGDGPVTISIASTANVAPPRMRGWTRYDKHC